MSRRAKDVIDPKPEVEALSVEELSQRADDILTNLNSIIARLTAKFEQGEADDGA